MIVRNGQRLGSVLIAKASTGPAGLTDTEREADRQVAEFGAGSPDQRADGVYSVGGGWHEIVVAGRVADKVRGADAAQETYEAHQQEAGGEDA